MNRRTNHRKHRGVRRRRSRRRLMLTVRKVRDFAFMIFTVFAVMHIFNTYANTKDITTKVAEVNETANVEEQKIFTPVIKLARLNIETAYAAEPEEIEEEIIEPSIPEKYSNIPLEDSLKEYIYDTAIESDIPPEILFSIAWKESNFNIDSISATNDYGLFQINQINFNNLAANMNMDYQSFSNNIDDPYLNTKCAVKIITDCKDKYNNDNWHQVLMRYNMGPAGAERNMQNGMYSSNYSRRIIDHAVTEYGLVNISL